MRTINLSNGAQDKTRKFLQIQRIGTNPEFGFIWIDDVCYTISKKANGKTYTIKKTAQP